MGVAQRVFVWTEPLHPAARSRCDGCGWPYGAALAFAAATGSFVLCEACTEVMACQNVLRYALHSAFCRRGGRLI